MYRDIDLNARATLLHLQHPMGRAFHKSHVNRLTRLTSSLTVHGTSMRPRLSSHLHLHRTLVLTLQTISLSLVDPCKSQILGTTNPATSEDSLTPWDHHPDCTTCELLHTVTILIISGTHTVLDAIADVILLDTTILSSCLLDLDSKQSTKKK